MCRAPDPHRGSWPFLRRSGGGGTWWLPGAAIRAFQKDKRLGNAVWARAEAGRQAIRSPADSRNGRVARLVSRYWLRQLTEEAFGQIIASEMIRTIVIIAL